MNTQFSSRKIHATQIQCVISQSMPTSANIPQESSLSSLLYIYYNTNLLDIPRRPELDLGFIDDIAYETERKIARENVDKLMKMLNKAEKWRKRNNLNNRSISSLILS